MAQKVNSAQKVFEIKLQTLYDIEKQLEKALSKMAKTTTNSELKKVFRSHCRQTEEHSKRLEKIFKLLELKPKKLKSEGIRGIIADGEWIMGTTGEEAFKDALLISSARYAEHYEMAGYASACDQANLLELAEIEGLLRQTLEEEKLTDNTLAEFMVATLEATAMDDE